MENGPCTGIMEVLLPLRHYNSMLVFCRTVDESSGGLFYGSIDDSTSMGLASFNLSSTEDGGSGI